jgi:hypothetical protein
VDCAYSWNWSDEECILNYGGEISLKTETKMEGGWK